MRVAEILPTVVIDELRARLVVYSDQYLACWEEAIAAERERRRRARGAEHDDPDRPSPEGA